MRRPFFSLLIIFCFTFAFLPHLVHGQEKVPVKLVTQPDQNDFVGKRFVYFITQGIKASNQLMMAGEESTMLICEIITTKVNGRPSSAYSCVVYANSYGKITPIMEHRLGICSNLTAKEAAQRIVEMLQNDAAKFKEKPKGSVK